METDKKERRPREPGIPRVLVTDRRAIMHDTRTASRDRHAPNVRPPALAGGER